MNTARDLNRRSSTRIGVGARVGFVTRIGVAAVVLAGMLAPTAKAEERKFVIMLAVPVKEAANRNDPALRPNRTSVYRQYFEPAYRIDPTADLTVQSFAQYWDEISYGNVTVSGDVYGWVDIPWPVLPKGDFNVPADETSISTYLLPYKELNDTGLYELGEGEGFDESQQMILIDYNGALPGTGAPWDPEDPNSMPDPSVQAIIPTPGLVDGVWTPGERFQDLNGNGRYDALTESFRDGWVANDDTCDGDGIVDSSEVCDFDGNNQWSFAEPFEDFLIIYWPDSSDPNNRWIPLDPSDNNPNNTTDPNSPAFFGSRTWAANYIRRNYPGDANALIARIGNGRYDGPDRWLERGSSKFQQAGGAARFQGAGGAWTPRPDISTMQTRSYYKWNYDTDPNNPSAPAWWPAYWSEKNAGDPNFATVPAAPEWPPFGNPAKDTPTPNVPNMFEFDPSDPTAAGATDGLRPFNPNAGGTNARSGEQCTPEGDPPQIGDPPADCTPPPSDAAAVGDGTVDENVAGGGIGTDGDIYPDSLDTNNDGLPDYYDGPAEYDDLPSSVYHSRSVSGLLVQGDPRTVNGGDERPGEVTSTANTANTGQDFGSGAPGGAGSGDGIIPAAGPLARQVHGTSGYDAGNQLTIEFLTWRNIEPSSPNMKRDFNLDGLMDLGEVRDAGTENYAIDLDPGSPNDGGVGGSVYPYNRQRLVEDTIAALDPAVDWDNVVNSAVVDTPGGPIPVNFVFGATLISPGLYQDGLAPGGRGLFQLPAPGMFDLPINVIEDPNTDPISPLFFSDFATKIDGTGESGQVEDTAGFSKGLMAHEFLHVWEGYPDLYDYDTYIGQYENNPVGAYDIMAASLLQHPSPFLKQFGQGVAPYGTEHEPWISIRNLRDILDPLEEQQVTLTDYAFDPINSAYFFDNPNNPGEFFYFWRYTSRDLGALQPGQINFNKTLTFAGYGEGMLIMHTDFGGNFQGFDGNFEGLALQQRIGSRSAFLIVQADGLGELEAGFGFGDPRDPWPGADGVTQWSFGSTPNSRWYGQLRSGIEIRDIEEEADQTTVTFYYRPLIVPEIELNGQPRQQPNSVGVLYRAYDQFGGTKIEFFYDRVDTPTGDLNPNFGKFQGTKFNTPPASKQPGDTNGQYLAPLNQLPGDGIYAFYAKAVPGVGQDNQQELSYSEPRLSFNSNARGAVTDVSVDPNTVRFESWSMTCVDDTTPGQELWSVRGSLSGTMSTLATTGQVYVAPNNYVRFRILPDVITGNDADLMPDVSGGAVLIDPTANFDPAEFKTGDRVRITGGPANVLTGFYTIVGVPSSTTLRLSANPGDTGGAGGVTYRVHSFSDGSDTANADRFSFLTTGFSQYSTTVRVNRLTGAVTPVPLARFSVSYPDQATNPANEIPLRVRFDASASRDELGQTNTLAYAWDFENDGVIDSTEPVVEHIYNVPGEYTVVMTITNTQSGLMADAQATIQVNDQDTDGDGVPQLQDNCPNTPNPGQEDMDGDGVGDACDNCPSTANANQNDTDGDGVGNVCDNCPNVPNTDQADGNGNGVGDACESDIDNDGVVDTEDNCPETPNPDQADADGDGIGDVCDNCPNNSNPGQQDSNGNGIGDACEVDVDADGVIDSEDNCPARFNPDQADVDADGVGNICDNCLNISNPSQADADGDGVGDACDNCPNTFNPLQTDSNGNGIGDACEAAEPNTPTEPNTPSEPNVPSEPNDTGNQPGQGEPNEPNDGGSTPMPPPLCGFGAVGMVPLMFAGVLALRLNPRRRRRR